MGYGVLAHAHRKNREHRHIDQVQMYVRNQTGRTQIGNTNFTKIHTLSTLTRLPQDQGPDEHPTAIWDKNQPPRGP